MPRRVAVQGSGVAACSCVYLLRSHGFDVQFDTYRSSSGPTLLINPSTANLLSDVFGCGRELLTDCHMIRRRTVLWGKDAEPNTLPHFGLVAEEAELLGRLWKRVGETQVAANRATDWRIYSAGSALAVKQHHFGSRVATAVRVKLAAEADQSAVCVESLECGWLFLLPRGGAEASLIAVGGTPDALLEQSRLVGEQVEQVTGAGVQIPAYPRILDSLRGADWLACGTAAMSFDPICGEGAGNAVREAILAAAVVRSAADGSGCEKAFRHYSSRLLTGFLKHLEACRRFYASGWRSAWWEAEAAELDRGIAWTREQLAGRNESEFRLVGFELEQLAH